MSASIVALAAAGWLVLGNNASGPDRRGGEGSAVAPAPPQDYPSGTGSASFGPSAAASASWAATPSHPAGPGATTGGPGTPAPGLPVSYRVTTDLCPSVDFASLSGLAGATPGGPGSGQKDYGESGYTD